MSSPWCTMAIANIRDPMTNNTASFMNDAATTSGGATPSNTCSTNVNRAIAGNGIGSNVTKIKTINNIMRL